MHKNLSPYFLHSPSLSVFIRDYRLATKKFSFPFLIQVFFGYAIGRGNTADLLELFVEMPLVIVPTAFCGFRNTVAAASEHILRVPYAGFYQVAVHRHAGFLPE
jgi:hypothetical protein